MNIILLLISFVEFVRDVSECCEVGYFGESCSYVCPKHCHNNECDRTSGICLSCVTGYYHSENKTCTRCPDNCAACDSNNFCFTCKSGYMGTVCKDVCSNCKADTSCDKITGYCLENCSDGLSGELCDIKCDSKCKSCDRYNLHECTSCEDDESGILCKEDCFSRCLKRLCNDSDESCTYDCLSENWEGKLCNKTCLTDCKERICDITCKEKGKKVLSMFEDNINIIVGIGAGVVGLIALGILWIVVRRRHSCKRSISFCTTSDNKTNSRYSIDQMEGNDDGGDMDSSSEPLNPMKKDVCNAVEKLGSCDNPIFIGDGHTEEYIASFGPVDTFINGFDVFLKMVWEEQCGKVVVLSSNDAEDRKFDKYFSSKRQHDAFTVACKKARNFGKTKYRMRVLTVKKQTQKREVAMFHFLTWSDECVPELVSRILDFQKTVNDFSTKLKGPTFVHLSAGEHRRATYITLDLLTKLKKSVNEDDVRQCIANLEKHGLEVIFEQIWNLACLANITITSDVDNTKKEIPSNQMNRFGSRNTESVNTAHNSIDASASSASVQQTLCNNKDQKTPKIRTNVCKGCSCSQFDESTPSQTNGNDVDETMAVTSLENKDLVDTNTCSPVTPNSNSAECKNANVDDDRQARIKAAMAAAKDIGRDVENFGFISHIFIDRDGQTDGYIASFGPVKCFIKRWAEFWKLVWDEQCGKVVVLSSSKDKEECMLDEYFSSKQQYGDFTVASKMERDSHSKHFKLKVLRINTDSQERDVELFHFLTWPDKRLPNKVISFLDFHKKVNDFTTELNGRTVVHCSGGVHRSATYIALDILTKRTKPINKDDICKCLQDLEKHGLETISDQIMKLAYVAGIISEPKRFKSNPRTTESAIV